MNLKEGIGIDRLGGNTIRGNFQNNKPHGECTIEFSDGGSYEGFLNFGKKQGQGTYKTNEIIYEGEWQADLKEGLKTSYY